MLISGIREKGIEAVRRQSSRLRCRRPVQVQELGFVKPRVERIDQLISQPAIVEELSPGRPRSGRSRMAYQVPRLTMSVAHDAFQPGRLGSVSLNLRVIFCQKVPTVLALTFAMKSNEAGPSETSSFARPNSRRDSYLNCPRTS